MGQTTLLTPVTRNYRMYTYDVWGNARDGYEVNDVYSGPVIAFKCERVLYDPIHINRAAFEIIHHPTERQIRRECFTVRTRQELTIDASNEDVIYVERTRDSRPLFELRLESNEDN